MPDSGYVMDELLEPRGELASRVLAMPTDTNPKGDIFGGWIMSLSSITLSIEVWTLRQGQGERVKVTDAVFTFVAVDDEGRPRPIAAPS